MNTHEIPVNESQRKSSHVREPIAEAADKARHLYESGKEHALEWEENLEDRVRAKPIQSILVAAGVGAGLGLLFGFAMGRK